MLHIRKALCVLLITFLLVQPVFAETDPPAETATAPQEPDIITAIHSVQTLPSEPNPLLSQSAENRWIRALITAPLYTMAEDGSWIPVLALALPEDVTAQYAGTYGIPAFAQRGYAFRIQLNPHARWQDGSSITADDVLFSIRKLFENEKTAKDWLFLANAEAIRSGKRTLGDQIISLREAGFANLSEAWSAGHNEFFVDTEGYWGLGAGWRSVSDRTRLRDYAMPSGLDEYFVTPAYLYRYYLMDNMPGSYYQNEFIGICRTPGKTMTINDLGILKITDQELVLVLQEPSTPSNLMLHLESFFLFRKNHSTMEFDQSCGPYCVTSADETQIILEPNPHWWGEADPRGYNRIICQKIGS